MTDIERKVYAVGHFTLIACAVVMLAFGMYVHYRVLTDDTPLCAPPAQERSK
jgi:hypothetical protein